MHTATAAPLNIFLPLIILQTQTKFPNEEYVRAVSSHWTTVFSISENKHDICNVDDMCQSPKQTFAMLL